MKTARKLGSTLRLIGHLVLTLGPRVAAPALIGATALPLAACADENDPQTWVKRLDDPAQKAGAIKRLTQFFEDAMTKANKNREDPNVKKLLDQIADPLTKTYTAGNLDDKTRKELIKILADTRDPRTSPALAKALNEYEPGKNEEDVKAVIISVKANALEGKKVDQAVVDGLWNVFGKWRASAQTAAFLARDLQDAIMAVKDPSYAPKALEKLGAPIYPKKPAEAQDQQIWQLISIQLIGHLKHTAAVKPLVVALLQPEKAGLRAAVNAALMRMPKESEPVVIAALNGSDADLKKLADAVPDKAAPAVICDTLAWISRPPGRDACLNALNAATDDGIRTAIATNMYRFPADPRVLDGFRNAYGKTAASATAALLGGVNARGKLARVAGNFYDVSLTDWLVKEIAGAKGDKDTADALQLPALESAIKLMGPSQVASVGDAVNKEGTDREKNMYKLAKAVVDKCKEDAGCYVKLLDEPIQSNTGTANMGAVKAAWMAAVYGKSDAGIRGELVKRIRKVTDEGARLAIVQAIYRMAPQGDDAAADEMEKVVKADEEGGNKNAANGSMSTVALSLRSRAVQ